LENVGISGAAAPQFQHGHGPPGCVAMRHDRRGRRGPCDLQGQHGDGQTKASTLRKSLKKWLGSKCFKHLCFSIEKKIQMDGNKIEIR